MTSRFRPTPTCDLHLGHGWVAMHNREDAWRGGDRFLLIIDDICYNLQNVWQSKWQPHVFAARFVEDLEWFGCPVDEVHYSTAQAEAHAWAAEKLGMRPCGREARSSFDGRNVLSRETSAAPVDGYHEWLTLTRLVDDHELGVQCFTRGTDLIGERQLYDYLWRRLYPSGLPPRQTYVPCVRREGADKKESTAVNAASIRALREAGYTAAELRGTLRECAARATAAGLADVVIPDGYLLPGAHKCLRHEGFVTDLRINASQQQAEPWGADVAIQVERVLERLGRSGGNEPSQPG